MWVKWLVPIVIIVLLGIIFTEREDTAETTQAEPILRSARQITMFEQKPDSDVSTRIQAQSIVEHTDRLISLDDFRISQSDGLLVSGNQARYDTDSSILTVTGPVTIDTKDGRKALLNGLVWDRQSQVATTDNPVVVEGIEGTIRADRAEFHDDFTRIRFLGGVHAKITQDILYN